MVTHRERKEAPVETRLLLLKDVEDLGRSGELVKVRPGYARNFLLPQQLAVVADRHTLRMQERLKAERAKQAALDREISEQVAAQVSGITLSRHVKVDPDGHMYGSVAASDIVEILEVAGIRIEKKQIQLSAAIRTTGLHAIKLKLKEGVQCSFKLKVLPEGMDDLPEEVATATEGASE